MALTCSQGTSLARVKDRSWGLVAIRKITGSEVLKDRQEFIISSLMVRIHSADARPVIHIPSVHSKSPC